ncbi:protein NATD1-like [Mercenaria mercenaria]|uniref:protein NATD1-like n=1 Tax=Mercenaria mercenaria TaxID=6596 RepID=UPI001E1DDC43|nr:protein NATD1-like [Mercenaria mercenaria]
MSAHVFKYLPTLARTTAVKVHFRVLPSQCRMTTSSFEPGKLKVVHDTEGQEFYIKLQGGRDEDSKAVLQYSYIKPDYVDLEHTVVPSQFRGHGVAKILAETAFDHFVEKGALIRPTCTYLQKFYNDNPHPRYTEKVKWD